MDDSYRINELANAVTRLVYAVEEMASSLGFYDDTEVAGNRSRDQKRRTGDAPTMNDRAREASADLTASRAPQLHLQELSELLAFALSFEDPRPALDVLSPN